MSEPNPAIFTTAMQYGAAGVLCLAFLIGLFGAVLLLRKIGNAAVKYLSEAGTKAGVAVDKNTTATEAMTRALEAQGREALERHHALVLAHTTNAHAAELKAGERHTEVIRTIEASAKEVRHKVSQALTVAGLDKNGPES